MIEYGKKILHLNEIKLSVYSHNERAINCYKKIGFKEYDREKNSGSYNGKSFDDIKR